ncbi:MAG: HAMP domain-containing protein [Betaproteobacteria bacterium]|nr:HAMP domain-containing protein [Betaproteobacteria bacterium]
MSPSWRARDYAALDQLLKQEVQHPEVERLWWTGPDGRMLRADHALPQPAAPALFAKAINIKVDSEVTVDLAGGAVDYGKLQGKMSAIPAQDRLWKQFVKQLQIVLATLLLMLQFLWLIFRMNLKTLRNLTQGANRFSQGDRSVRIESAGAPEVKQAAEAFKEALNKSPIAL